MDRKPVLAALRTDHEGTGGAMTARRAFLSRPADCACRPERERLRSGTAQRNSVTILKRKGPAPALVLALLVA